MIIQSHAIAIQIRPWSKTSHMVTWLTPEHGRITTSVKGACRPKSAFLGQYDLFYTCDLLFYRREHEGVHAIRECTPLNLREPLRHDWRRAVAAAYLADLTTRATLGHLESAALYTLLSDTLDRLAGAETPSLLETVLLYEINLLGQLGLTPNLETCPECHMPGQAWQRFSLSSGRLLCRHLASSRQGEATLALHRDVRLLYSRLSQPPPDSEANKKTDVAPNLLFGLSRFLGIFIAFHLEVPSAVRRVALEMLLTTIKQKTALLENC